MLEMAAHESTASIPKKMGSIVKPMNWILQALLFITAICIFAPFYPLMPDAGLDQSWKYGMNQAVAQGLAFGRDVIFTFGPYASIYTRMYHPATDHLMLTGGLWLGVTYGIAVLYLAKNVRWYLVLVFWAVLAGLMYLQDPLLLSYPLLVGLVSLRLVGSDGREYKSSGSVLALTAALFSSIGLLPLVKGSILILCAAIAALSVALFVLKRQWSLAITAVISVVLSGVFFWILTGQLLSDLPRFLMSMFSIASGYTEAMAFSGSGLEIVLFVIFALILLTAVLKHEGLGVDAKVFIFGLFFLFLFLAFKAGFVRHDGHAIISGTSALIAALLFAFTLQSRRFHYVLFLAVIVWAYIDSHHVKTSTDGFASAVRSTFRSAWHGVKNRLTDEAWLQREFDSANQRLSGAVKFPLLEGTTDIYSYNQSFLIASGNAWSPRPVLQSYSAYTPSLVEKNLDHLLGKNAPDNVIFKVEPIDGRLPALEDGASWPVLLRNYRPTAQENDFLFLRKHVAEVDGPAILSVAGVHALGSLVDVPDGGTPISAEVSVKQSLLGRLMTIFFKSSQLQISLNLVNGETKKYRFVAGMAKSGFLVSPLVESTYEFGLLYGGGGLLADKAVKSFSITPVGGSMLWQDDYEVLFKRIDVPRTVDVQGLYGLQAVVDSAGETPVAVAEKCDGSIDSVNGVSPSSSPISISGLLSVRGWLAKSVDHGALPDSVSVALRDGVGRTILVRTKRDNRPDVGVHFGKPMLRDSGFTSSADVSKIAGQYTLGLAFNEGDHVKICPQFNVPVTLRGSGSNAQH